MIRINLVPSDILEKAQNQRRIFQALVAGSVIALILAIFSLFHYLSMERLESRLAVDQAKLKKLNVIVQQVEKLEASAKAVKDRLGVITLLARGRTLYPYFMSDFVRSVPYNIQVNTLSVAGGGSQASPLKLTISAISSDQEDIAEWMKRLNNSGRFSNIELGTVSGSGKDQKIYNFTLSSIYKTNL